MTISIIIPIFNEEGSIRLLYDKLKSAFSPYDGQYEFIFIDDGSVDNSLNALKEIALKDVSVKIASFDKNYGQAAAFDAGVKNSRGDLILTIDGDLQYDPADLVKITEELRDEDVDMVLGKRINRTSGTLKKISSAIAVFFRNKVLKEGYQDCSLAGYKKKCFDNFKLYEGLQVFIPALLAMEGHRYKEIAVNEFPRKYGQSKYNLRNRIFKALWALCVANWMKRNKLNYKIIETVNGI